MPASVAMPAVRQNRSKLAPTCCQASSTIAAGATPAAVVDFVMALLSFADSAPRAYRLKVGNAYLTFSTSTGASPARGIGAGSGSDMFVCSVRVSGTALGSEDLGDVDKARAGGAGTRRGGASEQDRPRPGIRRTVAPGRRV